MEQGNPIDKIVQNTLKLSGKQLTPEQIDAIKKDYNGDTDLAMEDFFKAMKKFKNKTPNLEEKINLKAYYQAPLTFAEAMAMSEVKRIDPNAKNTESTATGYFQVTKSNHEEAIKKIYNKDFSSFAADPSLQEDYMYNHLVPEYENRVPELKKLFNEGYEKGALNDYKKYMVGGRFTDDQLKAMQHVLGLGGTKRLLTTGTTSTENAKRDVVRALEEMVNIRRDYGVPVSLVNQYDFTKVGLDEIVPYDILAAGKDKGVVTPPKTVPYQGAPLAPGRTKVDLISPFVSEPAPTTTQEPKKEPEPIKERYGYSWEQGQTAKPKTIEAPKPGLYATTENPVSVEENKIKEKQLNVGVNRKNFAESSAKLKELGNTYESYKAKPVDLDNLTDQDIQARDEIQQTIESHRKRLESSEFLLKDQFGQNVTKDIQNVLSNNATYTNTLNILEKKIKDKYQNATPSKIDIAPLAEKKNEISEEVKNIRVQRDAIQSKQEQLNQRLENLRNDPQMTQSKYDVIYASVKSEFDKLSQQDQELYSREAQLIDNFDDTIAQENLLINEFNKEVSKLKSEYANDPDVQELKNTYDKYVENWKKIENYRKSPHFDSYLDSISSLSELNPTYRNLFPDKMSGEERSKQLAKLAKDIVTKKNEESYLANEINIAFYDVYNGIKSIFTDAPAVGVTSTLINSLKGATFNLVGDFLGAAASVSDLVGAKKLGRELRVGDLFGLTVTGVGIEQDVARGAVRSDISGNPIEYFYTVKEGDDQLKSVGLNPGDRVIVEDGKAVSYRGSDDFKKNLLMIPGVNTDAVVQDFIKNKKNEIDSDFSLSRTVVSALPSAIDMLSLIGFNAAALPRIGRFITNKGLRTAAEKGLNFGAQVFQQYGDLYKSYLDKGLDPEKSAKFALGQSAGVALIEILNPIEMKVASLGGDAAVSQFRKVLDTTVDLYSRGQIGAKDAFNASVTGAITILKEIGKEVAVEDFQGRFENQIENFALNENKSYTLSDVYNTGLTTIAITAIPSYLMGRSAKMDARADVITSAIYNATKDSAKFEADALKAVKEGKMKEFDAAGIFGFVKYVKDELDTYDNLTDEQGAALTGLIGTRYSLENKKKLTNNEVAKKKIDEQINKVNAVIDEVVTGKKKVEVDPFVKPLYEEEEQPEADRVPTKKEFSDVVYATMPKEWQDMSKEEAWKSFQELTVQDQIKFFNTATGKKEEVAAPSTTAAGITKEQQAELDKVNKRAERIQRTLQEDTEVQEEGDEPLLTAEQKKKLETELQTLNQRRDAIQKQSTAEVPVQSGAQGGPGVGGQVQAESQGPTGEGQEAKIQAEEETIDSFIAQEAANVEITLALDDVNNRMNNAEYIEEKELNQRADQLYSIWDRIDSNPNLTNEQKESLKSKVETQIQKLEQYELATATKVGETVETRTVKGPRVIGTTTKKSPSKYEVTPERIAETKTTTVTDKKGNKKTGTWEVLPNGSLQVTDAKGNVVPVVDGYSFKETVKDKDGNVTAAVLEDKGTGTTFTVDNPDLALDIAIKAKEMELGPIEEGVFERVLQEVKTKAEPVLTREAKETPQAKKAEAPTPTPTTTEKVAQKAVEAPKKANTVQGFEITRKDGSKLPASDYVKDKKTGKWKRVAADGTTKGVSFAPYVKQLEDALSSPTAAETKATEAQTATAETVLEPIGKTSAEREKQIERFFTAAAGKDKAESSQMAKLTNNIWNSVAKFFGARNAQTANQWIQSKVALIGKTTTTEAGKLGTPRFQGDTDNPYTFAEAAEAVANNLITEIDRMIKERSNLANIKKRGFTKSQAAAQVRDLRKIKEDLLQAKKDPKWQVDAYHGTPYVFDKFSTEKIGTGEGAQAFGWGLYFTDVKSIAEWYANTLTAAKNEEATIDTKAPLTYEMEQYILEVVNSNGYTEQKQLEKYIENLPTKGYVPAKFEILKLALPYIKRDGLTIKRLNKNLYKTSLFKGKKPGDYTLLEWDKPLTKEQKRRIAEQGIKEGITSLAYLNENGVPTLNTSNEITAESYYKELQKSFLLGSPKEASLFLLRAGIDGIKYPAESIARGTTSDTARGFNYVIFDENDVAIEERVQFQQDAAKFRAAVITTAQNKLIVAALESPNASSFVHEGFHMFEGDLTAAEKQTIIDSYNDSFGEKETEFTTDVSEWGARMWEKYFSNGRQLTAAEVKDTKKRKALQDIFDNFTEWLKGVYEGVINYTNTKGVTKEVNIAPEVQALFDNIMGITTTPTPIAAETQVEAEAKTAEELSADIEADIEAAEAKEQMQTKNPTQIAGQELVNNPESAAGIPEDIAADLLDYVQGLKINIGGFKKIC